ncbi:MAG: chorismate mutase [Clostridia bacterium]|nr:chorismate mutase [Clostridia bacterium]MBR5265143.1 chorismate mutase [Clostridia bacterium]
MSKLEVLRRIIDECDSTIKEAIIKRFGISNQVAEFKAEDNSAIYDPNREKFIISNVTAGLDADNASRATTIWNTILRMSREIQYEARVAKTGDDGLEFIKDSLTELPLGDFACGSAIPALNTSKYPFLADPIPSQSDDEALKAVVEGATTYAIIKIKHVHDTEKLFDNLIKYGLFVNAMIPLESGQTLVIISKHLVLDAQHDMTTIIFHFPNRSGELAKYLNIIADKKINISFLRLSYDESFNTNIVSVDLEANLLDTHTRALVLQLQTEAPFFKVLASRKPY